MITLHLIDPAQTDIPFEATIFPDGQPHIRLDAGALASLPRQEPVVILSRITSPAELLTVLLAKNALDELEFEHVSLQVSYLLAARMDRVMTPGEPFSLKVVTRLLNTAGFRKVSVFDPHSDMSTALLDRGHAVTNHAFVRDALADWQARGNSEPVVLVSPDAGALKKIHGLAFALGLDEVAECTKERDVRTGRLLSFKTTAEGLEGRTCVVVDDLCDGGGTFAGTAALLRSKGAARVVLVVSHGIFSKGTTLEGIDAIYCTDSYRPVSGVTCYPVSRYLRTEAPAGEPGTTA